MSYEMYRGAGLLNEEWLELRAIDQWLLGVITDDNTTDRIGAAIITFNRWANTAADVTPDDVEESLYRLQEHGWVLICEHKDMVWLTRYMLERQVWRQPNLLRSVTKEAERCSSDLIREAALAQIAERAEGPGAVIGRSRKPIAPRTRLAVYTRDSWTCQGCFRVIPPIEPEHRTGERAPYDEKGWLELDHKVTRSRGGEDTVENFRALCTTCNQSRGDKPLVGGA